MLGDYSTHINEELIQLKQNQMVIVEYKRKFDTHIIYFFSLRKLDRVCIFVNGLDFHIKFMLRPIVPRFFFKLIGGHSWLWFLKMEK
jgi:hypothetical protein